MFSTIKDPIAQISFYLQYLALTEKGDLYSQKINSDPIKINTTKLGQQCNVTNISLNYIGYSGFNIWIDNKSFVLVFDKHENFSIHDQSAYHGRNIFKECSFGTFGNTHWMLKVFSYNCVLTSHTIKIYL